MNQQHCQNCIIPLGMSNPASYTCWNTCLCHEPMKHPSPITEEVCCEKCSLWNGLTDTYLQCGNLVCPCHKVEDSKKSKCCEAKVRKCVDYDNRFDCDNCNRCCEVSPLNQAPESKEWEERFDEMSISWYGSKGDFLRIKSFIRSEKELSRREGYEQGWGKCFDQSFWKKEMKKAMDITRKEVIEKVRGMVEEIEKDGLGIGLEKQSAEIIKRLLSSLNSLE